MKKLLLFLFFFISSPLVSAVQWQSLGQHSGSEYFFDKNSISGSRVERLITIKRNYIEGNFAPMSQEYNYKINCNSEEFTLISINSFKEPNLSGDIVPSNTQNLNIARKSDPQKVSALFIKIACASQDASTQVAPKSDQKSQSNRPMSPSSNTQPMSSSDQIPKAINFLKRPKNWYQVTTARQRTTSVSLANEEFYKTNNQTLVANVLFEYSQPQGDGSRSSVFTLYLNCSAPQKSFRLAQVKHYSEYAGRGRILGRETINESAQLIPEYDGYGFKRLWDEISWKACNSANDIQRGSMPSFEEAQLLLNALETVGQKQYNDYQIADEKIVSSERIAYERKPYGEKQNLPTPFNTVSSAGEHVAACVAATLAFEETAKGTNYNTKEARIWGGTAIRAKDQFPDPNFNPWLRKWFNQLKNQPASINLILFERCKRDFPAGAENTGFIR